MISPGEWTTFRRSARYAGNGIGRSTTVEQLRNLTISPEAAKYSVDSYGTGRLIEDLEKKFSKQFGKPAAAFFPSGIMAQLAAHAVHASRSKSKLLALHPLSHLAADEEEAFRFALALRAVPTDELGRPVKVSDRAKRKCATHIEIPLRNSFYFVPEWKELLAAVKTARKTSDAVHLDGARIWECAPYFKKSLREIARPFDSVYVSFYKGVGAISGAMLLGDAPFIAEAKRWRKRFGGTLVTQFPSLVSVHQKYRENGSKFPAFHRKAQEIAAVFTNLGYECRPAVPRSNAFCVILSRSAPDLREKAFRTARKHGLFLGLRPFRHAVTREWIFEFSADEETLRVPTALFSKVIGEIF